jgi:ABC-type nickel/cobalt efflux system permease component RcnA
MLIIGLLLLVGAVAVGVGVVYDGSDPVTVEILDRSVDTTVAGVYFAGLGTMLLILLGLWMVVASMGRSRRKRAKRRELRTEHKDSVSQLEEERSALAAENERLSGQLSHDRTDQGTDHGTDQHTERMPTTGQSEEHLQSADRGTGSAAGEQTSRHRGEVS